MMINNKHIIMSTNQLSQNTNIAVQISPQTHITRRGRGMVHQLYRYYQRRQWCTCDKYVVSRYLFSYRAWTFFFSLCPLCHRFVSESFRSSPPRIVSCVPTILDLDEFRGETTNCMLWTSKSVH